MALGRHALCLALGFSAACSDPTEVVVVVDTNLTVPTEIDEVVIEVENPGGEVREASGRLGAGQPALPRTLGVVHEGGPLGPFRVRVTGRLRGGAVLRRSAQFRFQSDEIRTLVMPLLRSCRGVACGFEETCGEEGCRSEIVPADELPEWTGRAPRIPATMSGGDAGVGDRDGGPNRDAGASAIDAGASAIDAGAVGDSGSLPDTGTADAMMPTDSAPTRG